MQQHLTDGGGSGAGPLTYSCFHYNDGLHCGGRNACPWKTKTAAEARKEVVKALINLAASDGED